MSAPLRLLHTSDWHLGQLFFGQERVVEHQCFLDWLLDTLQAEQIDVLLIAGDVYDQAHPAASTQRQFFAFLVAARQRRPRLQIVVIAGNHDSPARLEAPTPLLHELGIQVRGHYRHDQPAEVLLPLHDAEGVVRAWCIAMPYLRPSELPNDTSDAEDGNRYVRQVAAAYTRCTAHALQQRRPDQALIALGHLHVQGGQSSEQSERRLVVGGVEALDPAIFDPALAYVALGHLHLPQQFADGRVRYCGSPLPLSFTERDYPHQVLCLELSGAQLASVRSVRVPRFAPLWRVPETHAPVATALAELRALAVPTVAPGLEPWVEVRVQLDQPEPGLPARVHAALEGKAVRYTRIDRQSAPGITPASTSPALPDLAQLQPESLLRSHYQQLYGQPLPVELATALATLLQDHRD